MPHNLRSSYHSSNNHATMGCTQSTTSNYPISINSMPSMIKSDALNVKLRKLAFYESLNELVKPLVMACKCFKKIHLKTTEFKFNFLKFIQSSWKTA